MDKSGKVDEMQVIGTLSYYILSSGSILNAIPAKSINELGYYIEY